MTYCVGMLLDAGLVMLSDSRTNAGVDNISSFRKVAIFERPGERVIVLMTAGNLSVSQSVVGLLREALAVPEGAPNLYNAANMFEVARRVGDAVRSVHTRDAASLEAFKIEFNAMCIVGGQIAGEPPRLFNVYPAGNFIEATPETPYFQIGEFKYGKPIIDRVVGRHTSLQEAAKCSLVSMDSTMRSNLSVGMPLDLVIVRTDEYAVGSHRIIDGEDAYFRIIRRDWGEALKHAFMELPDPDWL